MKLNDINIFQEFEDLRYRNNISQRAVAMVCDVKEQSAQKWFKNQKIDDKYMWIVANSNLSDDRFLLALLCYELRLPTQYLNTLRKTNEDSLSMLIGTQLEDTESDTAILQLLSQLSMPKPNLETVGTSSLEMVDTGLKMILTGTGILKKMNIPVITALLERSKNYAGA